jgi:protein SDA1
VQGTNSSKKKKQAKLQRAMSAVKKQARREASAVSEGFAAVHLLHDPQAFAERLFARLQGSRDKWEARTAMMAVISRSAYTALWGLGEAASGCCD